MKTVWINFLSIIRRFKIATFLNIAGLTAAFTAFIIIMMQLHHEFTFEDYHTNASDIYRVELSYTGRSNYLMHNRPFIDEVIRSSPHITAGSLVFPFNNPLLFHAEGDETRTPYTEPMVSVYPDIVDIFNFDIIEGDARSLEAPNKVLIPQSLAKKLFGDHSAIGKRLSPVYEEMMAESGFTYLEVGGVYKDFPSNTQLNNYMYCNIGDFCKDDRVEASFFAYVLLNKNADLNELIENFNKTANYTENKEGKSFSLALNPLKNIYFEKTDRTETLHKSGNKEASAVLLIIAILVIIIATINYTNFSTSIAPMRIKSINTQKVLGASDSLLKRTLLIETLTVCMLSFILSLLLIEILNQTKYISFIDTSLSLSAHIPVVIMAGVIAVIVGIISGVYPAYFIMKYPPALVLKGSFGLSPAGKRFRTGLVGFQFIISFALIIAASFVFVQNKYMQQFNLGFETDQIAITMPGMNSILNNTTYINKLKQHPAIEDVAFASATIGGSNSYMHWGGISYQGENFNSYVIPVSWNFIDVMGIQYEGQALTPTLDISGGGYLIPNQKLKNEMEMQINGVIEVDFLEKSKLTIPGFTENINFKSLKFTVENFCFLISDRIKPMSYIKISSGANIHDAVDHIRKTITEIDPAWPVEIAFYDDIFDRLYKQELNTAKMVTLFSLLAIILSIVGVFSLVVFDTQYRFKEIGLRKVHGASNGSILWMFNNHYIKLLIICFIIACPFAIYGVSEWLKGFAYKTPLHWWVYMLSFVAISIITLATVTFQSWQASNSNPVNSIKSE